MKIVIIEDEEVVARELVVNIKKIIGSMADIVRLNSVKASVAYFNDAEAPDLIFSDIQLGDGLGFEIFIASPLSVPIIFCTAYDEYALDAFKTNGIDYILKPFTMAMLEQAIDKYYRLKKTFSTAQTPQYEALLELIYNKPSKRASSLLVHHKDKIIPVKVGDIALFHLSNEVVQFISFKGIVYYPNKTLDEIERAFSGQFFRANRQFLISRKSVIDASSFFSRKLSVNVCVSIPEKIIVSKGKASQFLEWLAKSE